MSLLWVGAIAVCPDGDCRIPEADRATLASLDALRHPLLDDAFAALTWLGSMAVLAPAAAVLVLWLLRRGLRRAGAAIALSLGGAWLLAHAAKTLVERPRPGLHEAVVAMPHDLSFPSAHAMQVTAFALAVLLALSAKSRLLWAGAVLLVSAVAASRLYLQVHFPSDVVSGVAAAACWTLGVRFLLEPR